MEAEEQRVGARIIKRTAKLTRIPGRRDKRDEKDGEVGVAKRKYFSFVVSCL